MDDKLRRARALHQAGLWADALSVYDEVLAAHPHHAKALHLSGIAALQSGDGVEALARMERAAAAAPDTAHILHTLGLTLKSLGRMEAALDALTRATQLEPANADAWNERGNVLFHLKRMEDAVDAYAMAIELNPGRAAFHNNRGAALLSLSRTQEALVAFDVALRLDEGSSEAHSNRGNALKDLGRFEDAAAAYALALTLQPDNPETLVNHGNVLVRLHRHAEAVTALSRAIEVAPDFPFAKGCLLHAKMLACDWRGLEALHSDIERQVDAGMRCAEPFGHQGISTSPRLLKRCAEIYAAERYPPQPPTRQASGPREGGRIRIGYLAGEFRNQATSVLMAELFECHDKSRFEIIALDNGWDDGSEMRARLTAAFDEFIDISQLSDPDAAALISGRGIDILVNLNGYFGAGRQGVFSRKPSPVQVNYLGFPGTLGAVYMDYLIADEVVIPRADREHYTEKIAYLPGSYQPNDRLRRIADTSLTRTELGLPASGIVFCCFNNTYKITEQIFDIWMRVLRLTPEAVLWLIDDNAAAAVNLRTEAQARGINPSRLIFAPRIGHAEHLARHRAADVFLDTLPYNAHTTASDALWAGLPVVTCLGTTFPGRVGASLLHAAGLPELVTAHLADYEGLLLRLAQNPGLVAQLKQKLALSRPTAALFDAGRTARNLERLYATMHERAVAGLPPDHIELTV